MIKDAIQFAKSVQLELQKVMWPKFDDYVGSTIVVLMLTTFFSIYLFCIDSIFVECAKFVFKYGEH